MKTKEVVEESFKGLSDFIKDKDILFWYKELIIICIEEQSKQVALAFAEWLMCIDNGTDFYNPKTKEKKPSIGISPYDCFIDETKTTEQLFELFKQESNL